MGRYGKKITEESPEGAVIPGRGRKGVLNGDRNKKPPKPPKAGGKGVKKGGG